MTLLHKHLLHTVLELQHGHEDRALELCASTLKSRVPYFMLLGEAEDPGGGMRATCRDRARSLHGAHAEEQT